MIMFFMQKIWKTLNSVLHNSSIIIYISIKSLFSRSNAFYFNDGSSVWGRYEEGLSAISLRWSTVGVSPWECNIMYSMTPAVDKRHRTLLLGLGKILSPTESKNSAEEFGHSPFIKSKTTALERFEMIIIGPNFPVRLCTKSLIIHTFCLPDN